MSRPRSRWFRTVAISLAVTLGSAMGTAWAAFSATTSNGPNSFSSAAADTTPPTISRVVAAKTSGTTPGTIRQGGNYYVYAQVTDNVLVATVTTNTSSFDSGMTAASLSSAGGPWTVGGLSYNYRSAVLTANTPLNTGSSYSYTVSATDSSGNSPSPFSASVTIETYDSVIDSTSGLVSYWRLGDGAISADELDDSSGTVLSSHTGEVGATWTSMAGTLRTAVITNENRLRKETGNGDAFYYTSATPASANYLVEADVHVKSLLADDAIAVAGRLNTGTETYYRARYDVDTARWAVDYVLNGTTQASAFYSQTLTAGQTYRLGFELNGINLRLYVNGVQRIAATDSSLTAAGRGGVRLGTGSSTAQPTNTTGLHLDNFRITSLTTTAVDGNGTNNGTYAGGVRLNQPDALSGDSNRAALFDGVGDYVSVARQISDSFSIEVWFKSTQGIGTGTHWWSGAGLVDAEVSGATNDFGLSLRSDGRVAAGVGNPDTTILSTSTGYNDGQWHHVVFTRTRSSGALRLYVDGQSQGSATGPVQALTAAANISFGRIQTATNYYSGSLDEVAIYNSVLSSSTVLDHYEAGTGTG